MVIGAVEKSFLLLEYLAGKNEPVSLGQAAEACGLPKPGTYRILSTLQKLGYAARPPGRREYQIGPRSSRLAGTDPHAILKSSVRPLMRKLRQQLDETLNLGVLSGRNVLYLDFLETSQPLRMMVMPGQNNPYFCTALGRAIVANWTDSALNKFVAETKLFRLTPYTVKTKADLMASIQKAREKGYAEEVDEIVEGVGCLAISLKPMGHPEAALSVAAPLQRLRPAHRRKIASTLLSLFN